MNDSADTSWVSWVDDVPQFAGVSPVEGWALSVRLYRRVLEMSYTSRLFAIAVCLFVCFAVTVPVWAGGPKTYGPPEYAFVSTGTGGQIYSVDVDPTSATYGATTLLVNTPGADYEGLVVGPNPSATSVYGPLSHSALVYTCGAGKIFRFDPAASPIVMEKIYDVSNATGAPVLQSPQCGRITSTGDLIVTDMTGSGWWKFAGVANLAIGSLTDASKTPVLLPSQPPSDQFQGVALKNSGDLLIVDATSQQVLKSSVSSSFSDWKMFASGLSSPFGIARKSDGQIYVSNQTSSPYIAHFDAGGSASCSNVSVAHAKTIAAMQMSPNDTLYVAGSAGSNGALFSLDASAANGCLGSQNLITRSLPVPAVGVALELPDFTAGATLKTSGGVGIVNFNYAAFLVQDAVGMCSLNVLARPTPPGFLTNTISALWVPQMQPLPPPPPALLAYGTTAVADNGWDGFETVVQTTTPLANQPGCLGNDGFLHFLLATQTLDANTQSPQLVSCADDYTGCGVDTQGIFPLSTILPSDTLNSGNKYTAKTCQFFLVDAPNVATENEQGYFCGFGSPLNNASSPSQGVSVSLGALPVKFRLAISPSNCTSSNASNFIGNALGLLSIEQIADANGNPVQVPIQISASGGSSPIEPVFNVDGNKNYTFSLQLNTCTLPSGATGPCPYGTYALTVTLLTNNTAGSGQSIYDAQTTYFTIKP